MATRGRPPHEIETAEFQISTTKIVVEQLKRLVQTGFFGKTHNEAAEQLVRQALMRMKGSEEFSSILNAPDVRER